MYGRKDGVLLGFGIDKELGMGFAYAGGRIGKCEVRVCY